MNLAKQNILNKQTAFILINGDSIPGELDWQAPQQICDRLALRFPDANVLLEKRSVDQTQPNPAPATIIHTGTANYTIKVIIDHVPGCTSLDATSQARIAHAFIEPPHLTVIALGTNDAMQGYPCDDYVNNLLYLGNTAKQVYGSDVFLVPPAWYGSALGPLFPGYAAQCELAAYRGGFGFVDLNRNFQRNYQAGNGYFGQKTRYSSSTDSVHFARDGHSAWADEFMLTFDL